MSGGGKEGGGELTHSRRRPKMLAVKRGRNVYGFTSSAEENGNSLCLCFFGEATLRILKHVVNFAKQKQSKLLRLKESL